MTKSQRLRGKHMLTQKNGNILCVDCRDKQAREKFGRMLRALRKKHKVGDLESEHKKVIVWGKSAAKQCLKNFFRDKLMLVDCNDAEDVWKSHCGGHKAFAGMPCDVQRFCCSKAWFSER